MSIASPSNSRLFNRLSMPFPLGSYQGLSFAIPLFSLPCLSTSKLFFSILRPSLSYPFFTLLFYAFALQFNAMPSPFMSIHCRCLSYQILCESLFCCSLPCCSFANRFFSPPLLRRAKPLQISVLLVPAMPCHAMFSQGISLHSFSFAVTVSRM